VTQAINSPALTYQPSRSLPARLERRVVQWRTASRLPGPRRPIVSFTFDDFPKSAGDTGADIVEGIGGRACFYACSSMAGIQTVSGEMFDSQDIAALTRAGHEIGGHTRSHLDCARAGLEDVLSDISGGIEDLRAMGLRDPVRQFAYPFGETGYGLKRALADRFDGARGILGGLNGPGNDRVQLRAVELDGDEDSLPRALSLLEEAMRRPAWMIVFTHDVRAKPGPWGVQPAILRKLAHAVRDAGAAVLTPSQAIDEITGGAP
jgi:peptidoglycan/xylan/chitin deacetylase (PgdA/CDA1 family)